MLIRPLFFEWPDLKAFYEDDILDNEFLIGKNLLCIPILEEHTNLTVGHFPNELFYEWKTGKEIGSNVILIFNGLNDTVPLYTRAGSIIPFQETIGVKSTKNLNNIFNLFVTLKNDKANGYVIGFQDFSEDNIDTCINNDYDCLWSIKLEIKPYSFMKISFFFWGKNIKK